MSLLASSTSTRTTRAAVVVAALMHVLVLLGLTQYGRTDRTAGPQMVQLENYQPITVVFIAQAAPAAPVAAPTPAAVPAPPSPRMPTVVQTVAPVPAPLAPAATQASREPVADAAPTAAPQLVPVAATVASKPADEPRPEGPPIQAAKPDYAYNPQPDYPMLLREQGVGGVVWLRVWVDSEGHPGEIKLAKGSGYRLLDDAALRAVRQWRFVPAKKGTQSLASWVEFPIRFTLNG